ncbi:MAG: 3'-5' exonuclease [Cyanobacteriota bacterium]
MAQQPSAWEQNDLLSLLAAPDPPEAEPPGAEPPPAVPPPAVTAPVTTPVATPVARPAATPVATPPVEAPPCNGSAGLCAASVDGAPPPSAEPPDPGPGGGSDPGPDPGPGGGPATLLILDTETTGLDPASGQCLEVGAVLFHVPSRAVLAQLSFLLPVDRNPARPVNGIDPAVTQLSQPWRQSLELLLALVERSDALLAHNAAFDRQWFGVGLLPALRRPWICSMEDIRWPADRQLRTPPSVRDLALSYGVPVWAAHRALTDCIYLAQVLERCPDLEALLVAAQEPRQLFRAQLSYAERHRAKQAGFRWNDPLPGAWTRRLSERELRGLSFPVELVPLELLPPKLLERQSA